MTFARTGFANMGRRGLPGFTGRGGGGAAAFNPASLGLLVWLDPSDTATMWQDTARTTPAAVGQPVASIFNKGSSGGYWTAAAGSAPVLRSTGGRFWLEFDGTNDCLASTALDLTASAHLGLAIMVKMRALADGVLLEQSDNYNGASKAMIIFANSGGGLDMGMIDPGYDSGSTTSPAYTAGALMLAAFQDMNWGDADTVDKFPLRVNGAAAPVTVVNDFAGATSDHGNYAFNLGARAAGTSLALPVDCFGLMMRGSAFSGAELGNVETWLAGKSGLTLP